MTYQAVRENIQVITKTTKEGEMVMEYEDFTDWMTDEQERRLELSEIEAIEQEVKKELEKETR